MTLGQPLALVGDAGAALVRPQPPYGCGLSRRSTRGNIPGNCALYLRTALNEDDRSEPDAAAALAAQPELWRRIDTRSVARTPSP